MGYIIFFFVVIVIVVIAVLAWQASKRRAMASALHLLRDFEPTQEVMGEGVRLVDSAEETAKAVARLLEAHEIAASEDSAGSLSCFVSDLPLRFRQIGELFLGQRVDELRLVDLAAGGALLGNNGIIEAD